jgi:hypothetical protein
MLIGAVGFGFLISVAIPVIYLSINRAVPAFVDAYLNFNVQYLESDLRERLQVVVEGIVMLSPSGLPILATTTWFTSLLIWLRQRDTSLITPIVVVGFIALPLEYFLVILSGRSFTHYYINWLPVYSVLTASILFMVFIDTVPSGASLGKSSTLRRTWLIALVAACSLIPLRSAVAHTLQIIQDGPRDGRELSADIADFEQDYVLMWGAEVAFNYFGNKESPSRFAYQYPLYHCTYAREDMFLTIEADIREKTPIIIDTSKTNPRVPALNPANRRPTEELWKECALSDDMEHLMDFIWERYKEVGIMESTGWPIYFPEQLAKDK